MNNQVIGSIILESANEAAEVNIISEHNGKPEATGIIQTLGDENRNGRIYEVKDMKPEIYSDRIQKELIPTGNMRGHDGHPSSSELSIQSVIDPKICSVQYTKIWLEGTEIHANFKGTNNQYGEEFDMNLRDGEKPAFSLRALGSIENRNGKAYVKNIKIITWDCVIYPSHRCAYTDKIISESAVLPNGETKIYENQIIVPENDPGRIITLTESDARTVINRLQRESANISTILETFEGLTDNISCINENTIILSTRYGEQIHVNLESYVDNAVMDYVFKL